MKTLLNKYKSWLINPIFIFGSSLIILLGFTRGIGFSTLYPLIFYVIVFPPISILIDKVIKNKK